MSKLRRSAIPTPAMVVACIALLVSLSGTAVALPGKNKLDANDFPTGVVRSSAIRNGGIATADLKDGIIIPSKLSVKSVFTGALQDGAVSNAKLGTAAVANSKLGSNAVTSAKIADNAVGSSEIVAGGVGNSDLADNAVTAAKIASNAVGASEIADNAVTTDEIVTNGVGPSEIAENAVSTDEIENGEVTGADIRNGDVTSSKLGLFAARNDATPTSVDPNLSGTSQADCAAGEIAISGGATWDNETVDLQLVSQQFVLTQGKPTGLIVRGRNNTASARTLTAQVVCLAP